jgi:hypothetical protein
MCRIALVSSGFSCSAFEPTAAMVLADKTDRLVITLAVRRETTIDSVECAWTGDDEIAPLA